MNEQTEKLLRELAEKLGVTVEHLWEVLIKQAPIDAWTTLGTFTFVFLLSVVITVFCWKKSKLSPERNNDWSLSCVIFLISSMVLFIAVIAQTKMVITALLNPEFWALKQLF